MQKGYVEINEVPTHIITWGQWIEDEFDGKAKEIVLMITGNPGLPGFYAKFCESLYNELDKEVPVWIISYAGMSIFNVSPSIILGQFTKYGLLLKDMVNPRKN